MATGTSSPTGCLDDLTLCPICFLKFDKPRMLPCSHTFCHHCLDGLIKSSCSGPISLGFTCPLCREFIAAPGLLGQFPSDKWAELFPFNQFITYLIEKCSDLSTIMCDACTEEEDVKATNWCKDCRRSFCENCTKMHKKFPAVCNHETVSLSEIRAATIPFDIVSLFCRKHEQNKLELFCRDHQVPSCALCVPILHRACDHICPIKELEEAAKSEKTNVLAKGLQKEMKCICNALDKIIDEEKMNIESIDEKTETYSAMIESAYEKSVQYLQVLKETQLNQIAKISKEGKTKLETSVKEYENRKAYIIKCLKLFTERVECEDSINLLYYSFLRENVKEIRKLKQEKIKIDVTATSDEDIKNFKSFLNLKVEERVTGIPMVLDVSQSRLKDIKTFTVQDSDIRGGVFLQDDRILLIDFRSKRCLLYTESGALEKEVKFSRTPWNVYVESEVLYITFSEAKEVKLIKLQDLSEIETYRVKCSCRGITKIDEKIFLTGGTSIETLNVDFEHIDEKVVKAETDDLTNDAHGNLIYSNYCENFVSKMTGDGNVLFSYTHQSLAAPYGLDIDHTGNIYVCGHESNNIHIISEDGKLLKIFDGLDKPQCIKIQKNTFKFLVAEENSKVKICELV